MGIRSRRQTAAKALPPCFLERFRGEPFPEDATGPERWIAANPNVEQRFLGESSLMDHWQRIGPEIVREWITARPGTRPAFWWEAEAPRWRDSLWPERLSAPRWIMVDGKLEEPAVPGRWVPHQHRGLWCLPPWSSGFPGQQMAEMEMESEASFLERHGLLSEVERRALGKYPRTVREMVEVEAYGMAQLNLIGDERWKTT